MPLVVAALLVAASHVPAASAQTGPVATVSVDNLDWGNVRVNERVQDQYFQVTNTGDADLHIQWETIDGSDAFGRPRSYRDCVDYPTLGPNEHCYIEVGYIARHVGPDDAVLSIGDDAADSPQTVSLSGIGTTGYWVIHKDGRATPFGDAEALGDMSKTALNSPLVAGDVRPNDENVTLGASTTESITCAACAGVGHGYWLAAADGGVFNYNLPFYGSAGGLPLNAPIVGITRFRGDYPYNASGYWLAAADGGVFNYGNAPFLGSMGGKPLNAPVVGVIDAGRGYYLAAADGGVFNFGDAPLAGSMGGKPLNAPVVAIATGPSPTGGYWLVASDGGIFAFGPGFYGSTGGKPLNKPIVGMAPSPSGKGYWLVAADGGVFAFGDAPFLGSDAGHGDDVVGIMASSDLY